MVDGLILLHNAHKLFVHVTLLFILFGGNLLHILLLLPGQLFFTQIVCLSLFPQFIQMLFFLRDVLLRV